MQRTIRKLPPQIPTTTADTVKRVAAYTRVSDSKLAMLESLAEQTSYYSSLIQKHPGWKYAGVFFDEGFTGTKAERRGFQEMLTTCREGKIDTIITKSISRFACNTLTLFETVHELRKAQYGTWYCLVELWGIRAAGKECLLRKANS